MGYEAQNSLAVGRDCFGGHGSCRQKPEYHDPRIIERDCCGSRAHHWLTSGTVANPYLNYLLAQRNAASGEVLAEIISYARQHNTNRDRSVSEFRKKNFSLVCH